jgi:eukaryotic-like serine/threonine-protein kinase
MPTVMPLQADDPRRVGRYRLTGRMDDRTGADGSTQRVFMARTVEDDTVIVTLLGRERVADAAARDRFTAEARVARRIAPFCVARILAAGIEGSEAYLVAEYVPGPTLTEAVRHEGPLPHAVLAALAIGTATGLLAIHQTGLVHGELGPDHVVLGPDGPRLTHFGITPPYGAATPAADLVAWARTVMFAAVGRPPVGPQDLAALPEDLREVVAACVAPDPATRPVARAVLAKLLSGHDLSAGLLTEGAKQARAAARVPVRGPATPRPPAPPAPIRSRSAAVLWAVACAVCLLAIVVGAVFVFGRHHGPAATQPTSTGPTGTGGPTATRPTELATSTPQVRVTRLPRPLPSARPPASLAGSWAGQVRQTDPVLTVSVRISLPTGSATGTITYPSLSCSGTLAIASVARDRLTLVQTIGNGRANCPDGVITLVSGPAGTAAFTFLRPGGDNPAGTLTRSA